MSDDREKVPNPNSQRSGTRFAITEIVVALVVVAVLVAFILPVYLNYDAAVDRSWEALTLRALTSLEIIQKELHLRTGTYGAGEFNRAERVSTLRESTGWAPGIESNTIYRVEVEKNGVGYRVTATSEKGKTLCRIYPGAKLCK